jgi:hypothetical protein
MTSSSSKPLCICDWPRTCGGSGMLECTGCGGDTCVCAACYGHGVIGCTGCDECAYLDDDSEDEQVQP